MNKQSEALLTLALELSEAARAELAAAILESLEPPEDADLQAEWRAEVRRRVAGLDSGDVETVPWEDVREELFQRLRRRRAG